MKQEKILLDNVKANLATAEDLTSFGIDIPLDKQDGLMYIKFKLTHSDRNANGDGFHDDDLEKKHATIVNQQFNINHKHDKIIGHVIASQFVPKSDEESAHVICIAVVYKDVLPDIAERIEKDFSEGKGRVSFESFFSKSYCPACDCTYNNSEVCEHIKGLKSGNSKFANATRILKDFFFAGVGWVKDGSPADKNAVFLAVAKESSDKFFQSIGNKYPATDVINFYNKLNSGDLDKINSPDTQKSAYIGIEGDYLSFSITNENKDNNISTCGGETMDKIYTQEDLDRAKKEAADQASATAKQDEAKDREISDLKAQLAIATQSAESEKTRADKAETEKAALQIQIDTAKAEKEQADKLEAEKALGESRYKEVTNKGFVIKEEMKSQLGAWPEDAYASFLGTLEANKKTEKPGVATATVEGEENKDPWKTISMKRGKK